MMRILFAVFVRTLRVANTLRSARKNNNDDVQLDLMLCAVTHVENRGTVRQLALMHHDGD